MASKMDEANFTAVQAPACDFTGVQAHSVKFAAGES